MPIMCIKSRVTLILTLLLSLGGALLSTTAEANALNVSPLRLDFSPGSKSTALNLRNFSSRKVPVQIQIFQWDQVDGKDVFSPTRDILFSPPITSIRPNEEQLIRFRLRKGADRDQTRNYRVFVEQLVPEGPDRPKGSAFKIRFSIPIFVQPLAVVGLPKPSMQVADLGNGKLQVDVSNLGNMHLKVTGIALYSGDTTPTNVDPKKRLAWSAQPESGNGYLLQNTTRRWIVDAEKRLRDESYQVVLITDFYDNFNDTDIRTDGSYWYPIKMK